MLLIECTVKFLMESTGGERPIFYDTSDARMLSLPWFIHSTEDKRQHAFRLARFMHEFMAVFGSFTLSLPLASYVICVCAFGTCILWHFQDPSRWIEKQQMRLTMIVFMIVPILQHLLQYLYYSDSSQSHPLFFDRRVQRQYHRVKARGFASARACCNGQCRSRTNDAWLVAATWLSGRPVSASENRVGKLSDTGSGKLFFFPSGDRASCVGCRLNRARRMRKVAVRWFAAGCCAVDIGVYGGTEFALC